MQAGQRRQAARDSRPKPTGAVERGEHWWPVALAIVVTAVLHVALPGQYRVNPIWVVPVVLLVLLAALIIGDPGRIDRQQPWLRVVTGIVVAFITVANLFSAGRLVAAIITDNKLFAANAPALLAVGGVIWVTNVIAFGLWYWDLDRGGAAARAHHSQPAPAFVFPEMLHNDYVPATWMPQFVDYLSLAFWTATAFSPTDVSAVKRWAKLLMILEACVSLGVGALVISRAINILKYPDTHTVHAASRLTGPESGPTLTRRPGPPRPGIGSSLLAAARGAQQHPRPGAQEGEVAEHLEDEHHPRGLRLGSDVPETHRREDGHAEVQSVRAGQRLGEAGRRRSFHHEIRRGEHQQVEGEDQAQRLDRLHIRVARTDDASHLPRRHSYEDPHADQQTHRDTGIEPLIQRQYVVENHQHRREQEAAERRAEHEPPALSRRQFLIRSVDHGRPPRI